MEEPTVYKRSPISRRFLTKSLVITLFFCIFSVSNLFALLSGQITKNDLTGLSVKMDDEYCFAGEVCNFVLKVPYIPPVLINTMVQALPDGVSFVSSRKDEYYEDGIRSTIIHFQFLFTNTGTVKMPTVAARVDSFSYAFPFDDVEVNENPSTVQPTLSLLINGDEIQSGMSSTFSVGDTINLCIKYKFASDISEISWTIPEDSVFTETSRYLSDVATDGYAQIEYTNEAKTAIEFEWIPLAEGTYTLPFLTMTAVSYGNKSVVINSPTATIYIDKATGGTANIGDNTNASTLFPDAFTALAEETDAVLDSEKKQSLIKSIAELRKLERDSIAFWSYRTQRKACEEELGLSETQNELPRLFIILSAVFLGASILAVILFFLRKKKATAILFIATTVVFTYLTISLAILRSKSYCVFLGAELKNVPEYSSSLSSIQTSGARAEIQTHIGKWLYISFKDGKDGWILEDDALFY